MSLFSFRQDDVVTSYTLEGATRAQQGIVKAGLSWAAPELFLATDSRSKVDLHDQFIVFQMNNQLDGPPILESSQVAPKLEGSKNEPDVMVALEMVSFYLGEKEHIEPDTRATMRITFGKDESSTDKGFDTVFWSIAAGLRLYEQTANKAPQSKDFKMDLQRAFGKRPIEIYGGLGKLSFEVVKHREPSWWTRVFKFLQGDTGKSLVSVLGFPAITSQAIDMLDELLNRLTESEPEILFKSIPMRLALSKYAHNEFTGDNPRVKLGCVNPGFCVMARGRDLPVVSNANVIYHASYGKLVPINVSDNDLMAGEYDDPLKDVTYAVFRVRMKSTKIDPTFKFS